MELDKTTTTTTRHENKFDDESFPQLTNSNSINKKKKKHRGDRTDTPAIKKPIEHDPFAGMNTGVNYQQEIERLKAMVQKVDKKRGPMPMATAAHKPSPASLDEPATSEMTQAPRSASPTSPVLSSSSSTVSSSSSSVSSISSASSNSGRYNHHECANIETNGRSSSTGATVPCSTITEEEKMRFLEFVRSWTGGWHGWHPRPGETDSLWQQTPWDSQQRAAHPAPPPSLSLQGKLDDLTIHVAPPLFTRPEWFSLDPKPSLSLPSRSPPPASPAYFSPFDLSRPPRHTAGIIGDRHPRRTSRTSHPSVFAL